MTGTAVDADLSRLRSARERITTNLLELEQHPTRGMLDAAPLRGASAVEWQGARTALAELFRWNVLLGALLDQATKLRGTRPSVPNALEAELASLLRSRSIELSDSTVPLAARGLLSASRAVDRCTPDELLERMAAAFDRVRNVVMAATDVWDRLVTGVQARRSRVGELEALANAVGCTAPSGLLRVRAELDELADVVLADPLTVDRHCLDRLDGELHEVRAELEALRSVRDDLDGRLGAARSLLDELHRRITAGQAAHRELAVKIAAPAGPEPMASDQGAADGLDRVERLAQRGDVAHLSRELAAWQVRTEALVERARWIEATNQAPIEERGQLRGLLDAYRAKAGQLGRLEEPELRSHYERASTALYTSPTDLRLAADLVRRYQEALRSAAPSRGATA